MNQINYYDVYLSTSSKRTCNNNAQFTNITENSHIMIAIKYSTEDMLQAFNKQLRMLTYMQYKHSQFINDRNILYINRQMSIQMNVKEHRTFFYTTQLNKITSLYLTVIML